MTINVELGKRLVACKHFYWMPGMLVSNGAIGLGAEPAPSGPIPMLLEGVRDAENTLDPDDFKE